MSLTWGQDRDLTSPDYPNLRLEGETLLPVPPP